MALTKNDVLALGRGNLTNNSDAAIVFTSNNVVDVWSNAISYAQYNIVEYSGKVYRSKIASNLANQPDTSPNQWETLYNSPKDGDICFVVNGSASTILQRNGSAWGQISGSVISTALNDNQPTPTDAIVFISTSKAFLKIEYTIRRGAGQGTKRRGVLNILSDTAGAVEYDHEFSEIGSDVGVQLSVTATGTTTKVQYTSQNFGGVPIELKYSLIRGWS